MTAPYSQALLDWYFENRRDLPFRRNRDPYRIWVSEIMAQQTRIDAMIPYFERFMTLFPDIPSLADADEDQLHKAWEGLGYYSRVRNLQKTARIVRETGLPESREELLKLPGIGPYTAGAIASISFGQKAAAVDGNVLRVYARLHDIHEDVMKPAVRRRVESLVLEAMIEPYGDFTQALMELGALVCIPGTPRCELCPIRAWCQAKDPAMLPVLPAKKKKQEEIHVFCLYTDGQGIRLVRRPSRGLLAGLYGFPEEEPPEGLRRIRLEGYDHVFTHRVWHIQGWLVFTEEPEGLIPVETIDRDCAIPTAFAGLYRQARQILAEENLRKTADPGRQTAGSVQEKEK